MALSDEEQRLLDQMEAALAAEDPKLASTLRGASTHRLHRRRAVMAAVGFLIGVVALVGGMEVHPAVSIVGFLVMLVSTLVAVSSWRQVDEVGGSAADGPQGPERAFLDRIEERWRRNHEDGA